MHARSEQINELSAALIKAQAEFPEIPKTKEVVVQGKNGSYVFKYAPLESMLSLVRPVLHSNSLGFTQGADGDAIVTTILHASGQFISHRMPIDSIPYAQQYGAQFTYRRRYSLKAALGIETDEDDADNLTGDEKKKTKITPNADAMDQVAPDRKEWVRRQAYSIVDCWNAEKVDEAYKCWCEVTDNGEKLGVWSFLDSKMRRELKKRDEAKAKEK